MNRPDKFMFESLEEYAEISGFFNKTHPSWQAFEIVWNMARVGGFKEETEIETEEK